MGWPYHSFGELGSMGYENWGMGGFPIGSGTTRSPGLVRIEMKALHIHDCFGGWERTTNHSAVSV